MIRRAAGSCGIQSIIHPITTIKGARFEAGVIDVLDLMNVDIDALQFGKVSALAGEAAFQAVRKVIELALERKIDATVTGPISKEAIQLAGHDFSGHTEIYAHYTDTKKYAMLLIEGSLRVVHVSTHVSLREACDLVTRQRVLETIELAYSACRSMGINAPRVGVAGLNPHAGENGRFGREEQVEILPAILQAKEKGIDATGPVPADTLFSKAIGGMYDIVVAMYHDQGHIPLKVIGFQWDQSKNTWTSVNGVNITLGLPIIRTSVDHGTAYDLAGMGTASEMSMVSAIGYAVEMAQRNNNTE
jgi:4-hydroxythreonine-4-phosphate dehydrogenase